MALRIGKYLFLGLAAGYLWAALLGHWTWLAMRINTSWLIPVFLLLGAVVGLLSQMDVSKTVFLSIEILIPAAFLFIYRDPSAMTVIPAIMLREAFGLRFLSLLQGNVFIILLLLIGNLLWFWPDNNKAANL